MSLSIKYIFFKLTAPWTTSGISLFQQINCGGGIGVHKNTPKSHSAVRPPITYPGFLLLISAHALLVIGGMVQAHLLRLLVNQIPLARTLPYESPLYMLLFRGMN
jgi:hypothetical protein